MVKSHLKKSTLISFTTSPQQTTQSRWVIIIPANRLRGLVNLKKIREKLGLVRQAHPLTALSHFLFFCKYVQQKNDTKVTKNTKLKK